MQSTPRHYQQLQPEDRVTLASLVQQKYGIREIAGVLNRSPSTISRELSRNTGTEGVRVHGVLRHAVTTPRASRVQLAGSQRHQSVCKRGFNPLVQRQAQASSWAASCS